MTDHGRSGVGTLSASLSRHIRRHRRASSSTAGWRHQQIPLTLGSTRIGRRWHAVVRLARTGDGCSCSTHVRTGGNLRAKATYLLGYPGSHYLSADPRK
jgi:hypothetical protein